MHQFLAYYLGNPSDAYRMTVISNISRIPNLCREFGHVVIEVPHIIYLGNDISQTLRSLIVTLILKRTNTKTITQKQSLVE